MMYTGMTNADQPEHASDKPARKIAVQSGLKRRYPHRVFEYIWIRTQ
jgi:hypothetical protein